MSVVTLLTAQNTQQVSAVVILEPEFILSQLDAALEDIPPLATKTGALGNSAVIEVLAARAKDFSFPLVVDPVMVSKHGAQLIDKDAIQTLKYNLLPQATIITPNLQEASILSDIKISSATSMETAALAISELGVSNVLIKSVDWSEDSFDLLLADGHLHRLPSPRIDTQQTHGSGCVLSAAVTVGLAKGKKCSSRGRIC